MSINFKKVGTLTKVEVTGLSTQYYETLETSFDFVVYEDGTNRIKFTIDAPNKATLTRTVLLTDIKVDGVSITNKDDFDIKIATVFLKANSGSGNSSADLPSQTGNSGKFLKTDGSVANWDDVSGIGTLQKVLDNGSVLDKDNEIDASGHDFGLTAAYFEITGTDDETGSSQIYGDIDGGAIASSDNIGNVTTLKVSPTSATVDKNGAGAKEIATEEDGVSGTFTTITSITVVNGIITDIQGT